MRYMHPKRLYNRAKFALHNFIVYWLIPDKWYLSCKFKKIFGRPIDWKDPKSFNEKINWLKVHDKNPKYHLLVDKLRVKSIVTELLGEQYVIPNLTEGYKHLSDIDIDALPNQFVLKCNHDAGSVVVCKDKSTFDWTRAEHQLNWCMAYDYYYHENKQWAYKDIDRCIFVEQYMEDDETKELRDYKFFCFNGKVKCFKIDYDRYTNHRANYYDVSCNLLPFYETICPPDTTVKIRIPSNINEMIELAEKLSYGMPFIRIDFYDVNGHVYFGEYTFYPDGGFGKIQPEEWDYILGSWMDISALQKK